MNLPGERVPELGCGGQHADMRIYERFVHSDQQPEQSWKGGKMYVRADSRLAPNQWETSLQSNAVSHWLGVNLESALYVVQGPNPLVLEGVAVIFQKYNFQTHY